MRTNLMFAAGLILLLTSSCNDDLFIRGNGIPVNEARLVPAFSSVSSEGDFKVHILSGEVSEVRLYAESNLLPFIQTDVKDKKLRIHVQGIHSLQNQVPIEVYVTVPFPEAIVQNGSGSITTDRFVGEAVSYIISGSGSIEAIVDAEVVEAIVSGSGNLSVAGTARDATLTISGSGKIDAWNLPVQNCSIRISGSGDVWTEVDHYLKAVISGSGNVFYHGTPYLETVVSGSGSVIHKN